MVGSFSFYRFLAGGSRESGTRLGKRGEVSQEDDAELGLTEELRQFVRSFTADTFKEFRVATTQQSVEPSTSGKTRLVDHRYNVNVQKELTEWQERHALRILSTVKEISELRYVLCPRHLEDKDFWKIYFLLVKNYVAPYEISAIRKAKIRSMGQEAEKTDTDAVEVEMMSTKKVECAATE